MVSHQHFAYDTTLRNWHWRWSKSMEHDLWKEMETIEHITFECIICRLLWGDVLQFFTSISLTLSWLHQNGCKKRILHLKVVSSTIQCCVRGLIEMISSLTRSLGLMSNMVWRLVLFFLRNWKVPFNHLEGESACSLNSSSQSSKGLFVC
jgi:hypothetical protein